LASTRTLNNVVSWAQSFIGLRPLAGIGGIAGEPALSIANTVLGFILGPPFCWRWNRNKNSFVTMLQSGSSTTYNQPYLESVPDFGFLEKATISDGVTTWPLEVRLILNDDQDVDRPEYISAEVDDDAGNITFKLVPPPDKAYTVKYIYQKKPVLFTALGGKWAPIPDEMQYLYNTGFLASAFEVADDARFPIEYQKHVKSVIAASEGLSDTQKALFLEEKLVGMREQSNEAMGVQQGRGSRGMQ
jgi:hypothetical protein